MIGLHLLVDGVTEERVTRETVERILTETPPLIDMNILSGPYVVEGVPENPGWTGFVIIDKSHISVHTFSDSNTVSVDVFSCRPFNAKKAVRYLQGLIAFKALTTRTLVREIV